MITEIKKIGGLVALVIGLSFSSSVLAQVDNNDDNSDPIFEEPGDDEGQLPTCGAFSFATLFDVSISGEINLKNYTKSIQSIFADGKDLWELHALENAETHDEVQSLISEVINPTPEGTGNDDEELPVGEDPSFDPGAEPTVGACYSIEDLLSSINENGCTAKEKKIFKTIQPKIKKALSNSGPFVDNEFESAEDAASLRTLLTKVSKKCMPKAKR